MRRSWPLESIYAWLSDNVTDAPLAMLLFARFYNGNGLVKRSIRLNWGGEMIRAHITDATLRQRHTTASLASLYHGFSVVDLHPETLPAAYINTVTIAFLRLLQTSVGKGDDASVCNMITSDRTQTGRGGYLHVVTGVGYHSSGLNSGRNAANLQVYLLINNLY